MKGNIFFFIDNQLTALPVIIVHLGSVLYHTTNDN
jgi:hypothetical protein